MKKALGVDTYGIQLPTNFFGYRNENWKPFRMFDGTEVLVPGKFEYDVLPNGDIVQYPKGDRNARPSGRMPKGGFYFDSIVRQEPIDEARLDPKEWVAQTYSLYTDEDLRFLEETSPPVVRGIGLRPSGKLLGSRVRGHRRGPGARGAGTRRASGIPRSGTSPRSPASLT